MSLIDALDEKRIASIRLELKSKIFEDIREKKLFGFICLWQTYMVKDFKNKLSKEQKEQLQPTINHLIVEGVFIRITGIGYKLTLDGEETVYKNNEYTVDKVVNKILIHLRDSNYICNVSWPKITAMTFLNELCVYEQRLFNSAINKMIDDDLFIDDDFNYAFIITKKCENKIFGLE